MAKKERINTDVNLKDAYRMYKQDHQYPYLGSKYDKKSVLHEDFKTYSLVLNDVFKEISRQILYERKILKLPYRLGMIRIQKKKMNIKVLQDNYKLKQDYQYFKKTGKRKFFLNEHVDYHRYRWLWQKRSKSMPGIKNYCFVATRENKRSIAAILNENPNHDWWN